LKGCGCHCPPGRRGGRQYRNCGFDLIDGGRAHWAKWGKITFRRDIPPPVSLPSNVIPLGPPRWAALFFAFFVVPEFYADGPRKRCQSYSCLNIVQAFTQRFQIGPSFAPLSGLADGLLPRLNRMPSVCHRASSATTATRLSPAIGAIGPPHPRLHTLTLLGPSRGRGPSPGPAPSLQPRICSSGCGPLGASFTRHLAMTPSRIARSSPPSGWRRDLDPKAKPLRPRATLVPSLLSRRGNGSSRPAQVLPSGVVPLRVWD